MSRASDITHRFGQRVRERRTALGLSQESFADKCGLDRAYIGGIERGRRNVTPRVVEILAQHLGMSISELTEGL